MNIELFIAALNHPKSIRIEYSNQFYECEINCIKCCKETDIFLQTRKYCGISCYIIFSNSSLILLNRIISCEGKELFIFKQ